MYIRKRAEIMKALRKEKRRKREGFDAGYVRMFVDDALKDLESALKSRNGRDNLEFVTGIRTKRVGFAIF